MKRKTRQTDKQEEEEQFKVSDPSPLKIDFYRTSVILTHFLLAKAIALASCRPQRYPFGTCIFHEKCKKGRPTEASVGIIEIQGNNRI